MKIQTVFFKKLILNSNKSMKFSLHRTRSEITIYFMFL
jgi:hypothetical protein